MWESISFSSVYNEESILTEPDIHGGNETTNSEDHDDVEMKLETTLPPTETALTAYTIASTKNQFR